MNDELEMKGTVKIIKNGKTIKTINNLILDTGLDATAQLLGGLNSQSEFDTIAVGDDPSETEETQEDLQGSQLNYIATTNENPDTGIIRFIGEIENTSGDTSTHYEAVLADGTTKGDRVCLSRVIMPDGVELLDGESITYLWRITISR